MATLALAGVHAAYDGDDVLRDVTLSVGPGEFAGVIGPNGSGKSTLVRVASGVMAPRAGTVTVDGAAPSARVVAVVPQETAVDFDFTCREIVTMGRFPHGDEDPSIVRDAMERSGTWELRDRLITELSGGERQRVVFARALAQAPQVLLMDEPTAHLDIRYQLDLMRLVRRETQLAVLCVMHDLNLAAAFCTRLILLHEGAVFAEGAPADVLTAENLRQTYSVEADVQPHPRRDGPLVVV